MSCRLTEVGTLVKMQPEGQIDTLAPTVVRVLPDEPGINKAFDYAVPSGLASADLLSVGTIVRVPLNGRRVGGWVTNLSVETDVDFAKLRPIAKVSSLGPPSEVLELADWAAWRWWGRTASVLRFASPDFSVRSTPQPQLIDPRLIPIEGGESDEAVLTREALARVGVTVVQLPPSADVFPVVLEAARFAGSKGVLVVCPSTASSLQIARRLQRSAVPVAWMPREWAKAAAGGCVVVGARSAVWAPIVGPGAIVVIDEHDDLYKDERTPSWNARDVAVERASRLGVPCILTSPCPSLDATSMANVAVLRPSRRAERNGWPVLDVIDRTADEPGRQTLFSPEITDVLRNSRNLVCVLNRTGRARSLACGTCGQVARCETCGSAVVQETEAPVLHCKRCHEERPVLCLGCGGGRLRTVRMGVAKAREELEVLCGRPVHEVTSMSGVVPEDANVLIGTVAVLHRVDHADAVVFLDFDTELLAPRYRAAEQAMAMLVRAARLTGGRSGGRIVVQTRLPHNETLAAFLHGDPGRLSEVEMERRTALDFPPASALAHVSGLGAPAIFAAATEISSLEVLGAEEGPFLLRAKDHQQLADGLAKIQRPAARVRVVVDPLDI